MKFSKWLRWNDRNELKGINNIGIYCITVTEIDISNSPFQLLKEIEYFGMTNSKGGLKSRLKQFDNTLTVRLQHGGADRFKRKYFEIYGKDFYHHILPNMFVAIWSFDCTSPDEHKYEDQIIMGEVAKAEYDCFAEYLQIFGRIPDCNDKKNSKKYSSIVRENDSNSLNSSL
jgi:hypothetical protein